MNGALKRARRKDDGLKGLNSKEKDLSAKPVNKRSCAEPAALMKESFDGYVARHGKGLACDVVGEPMEIKRDQLEDDGAIRTDHGEVEHSEQGRALSRESMGHTEAVANQTNLTSHASTMEIDFSNLAGVGDHSDDSEADTPLETVAMDRLPGQYLSEYRNDETALKKKLADIAIFTDATNARGLPFWESLSVTMPLSKKLPRSLAMDDLKREQRLAELATASVHLGLDKLRSQGVRFRRPSDYFAEMVKTDSHMGKVKARILHQKEKIESAETRRNNREIAKNKKKVRSSQLEKEQEKKRKANEEIEAVSRLRKQRLKQRADTAEGAGDDSEDPFPIELLDVEQLDEESKFRPESEIKSGKRKAWKGKGDNDRKAFNREDSRNPSKMTRNGKAVKSVNGQAATGNGRAKGKRGTSGGIKKPKGSKKRLGRSRRKAAAARQS